MLVENKRKQLVLAILSIEKKALSPSQLTAIIGAADKNRINLCGHYLCDFWKKGIIIRSERKINLEYYYFFGNQDPEIIINGHQVRFIPYTEEINSRAYKKRIQGIIQQQGPLTVKEICLVLRPDFDIYFQRKINFHLQDLFHKQELFRSSRPFQYYSASDSLQNIAEKKASLPTLIISLFNRRKTALWTSELITEIKNSGIIPKLSAVSLALKRLCRQQKLVSSATRFGTRSSKTGYLWALTREQITERFRQELPPALQQLLHAEIITQRQFCTELNMAPATARRWMRRIALELTEFELNKNNQQLELQHQNKQVYDNAI